ncbi:TolC family protein, partial [Desulfovibrio sp. OttesenSCG-928-M14]|nr:TolC family protein [Desulfovibrio sp. OttesenSCG-928-M14]
LFDWGSRSRNLDKNLLRRVANSQSHKLARQSFAVSWKETWQNTKMARAELRLAEEKVTVCTLAKKKSMLEEQAGTGDFALVITAGMEALDAEIALEEARRALKNIELGNWMTAGYFRQRFFEPYDDEDIKEAL